MRVDLALRDKTTALLQSAPDDPDALKQLLPLLYDDLRQMAHRQLGRERQNHTLQTTALVHEAYMRLIDQARITQRGRAYFFAAAAGAMRQVLIDYARRRKTKKRGGGKAPLSLKESQLTVDAYADELLDLNTALDQLEKLNPRHVRVVECRFFGGMTVKETALALEVSPRTIESDWAFARAWLRTVLQDAPRFE